MTPQITDDELVRRINTTRDQQARAELKRRHTGLIKRTLYAYRGAPVSQGVIELELSKLFDEAVRTYKPNQRAKFGSWLGTVLRRVDRFVKRYQNVARIPEERARLIGPVQRADSELTDKLGRVPTSREIGKHIGQRAGAVDQVLGMNRKDLFDGGFEANPLELDDRKARIEDFLYDARSLFTGQHLTAFDHLTGQGGKRKITDKRELARVMRVSPGRISQITGEISRKLKPHLDEVY